jgi:FKBP-type peptidyl-prolyl cis-trans isomerase FklB
MKKTIFAMGIILSAATSLLADGTNVFNDDQQRDSYAIGMMLGHLWQQQGIDVDLNVFVHAVRDVQSGGNTLMTPQEMHDTLLQYQKDLAAKQQKIRAELAAKNKADGDAFLDANKSKPGVITLPSGVQYKVISDGNGAVPAPTDTVQINFRGTLINGAEFDSTARRGKPMVVPLAHYPVRGLVDVLTHMKTGSVWEVYIPSELAYGPMGAGPSIPPNSVLVFSLQLVSIGATPSGTAPAQPLTSDIIKVPSAEEMKNGAKIEIIKPEDISKYQTQSKTN